jgi:radical SAM superfamily enzyme YgiQ (UPF0313 family)
MITTARALLVNPWIYDFKAFDFWMKPVGLLYLASILRKVDFEVDFIDCLDRYQPLFLKRVEKVPKVDQFGRGKFYHEEIEKPEALKEIKRTFKRYGMPKAVFEELLDSFQKPDVILVTSIMTYWYLGVFEAIRILKRRFPGTPIVLGGIYATFCYTHAQTYAGADCVVAGPGETQLFKILYKLGLALDRPPFSFPDLPRPAFDLYPRLDYACILTSRGCPFRCSYCGVCNLFPGFVTREPGSVIDEIEFYRDTLEVKNIAFYDDALLANPKFEKILDEIIIRKIKLNFHSPNGLHARFITDELAHKMRRANFKTIYLSLETIDEQRQKATGGKVNTREFEEAVGHLKNAGFPDNELHAYLMIGLPGQTLEEMIKSIDFVCDLGLTPHLAEFSPIPGTPDFLKTGFDATTNPLLHNNTIFPAYHNRPVLEAVKQYLAKKRKSFGGQ